MLPFSRRANLKVANGNLTFEYDFSKDELKVGLLQGENFYPIDSFEKVDINGKEGFSYSGEGWRFNSTDYTLDDVKRAIRYVYLGQCNYKDCSKDDQDDTKYLNVDKKAQKAVEQYCGKEKESLHSKIFAILNECLESNPALPYANFT